MKRLMFFLIATIVTISGWSQMSTFPFTENFDAVATAPPTGWLMYYNEGSPTPITACEWNIMSVTTEKRRGSTGQSFKFNFSACSGVEVHQYLITPLLDCNGTAKIVRIYYAGYADGNDANNPANWKDDLRLGYSTTDSAYTSFTWTDWMDPATNGNFGNNYYLEMLIPAATTYVCINAKGMYWYYIYVDDFSIEEAPACTQPIALALDTANNPVTANEAQVYWLPTSTGVSYEVNYKAADDATWQTDIVTDTFYYLSNLSSGTNYNFRVREICTGTGTAGTVDVDYSQWSTTLNFQTLITCPVPTNVVLGNVSGTSATLTWTDEPAAYEYEIQYKPSTVTDWDSIGGVTVESEISGVQTHTLTLLPSTTYNVRMRGLCSADDNSQWVVLPNITTPCLGLIIDATTTYTQDFDAGMTIPTCWMAGGFSATYYPEISTLHSSSGTNALRMRRSSISGRDSWIMLPIIDPSVDMRTLQVSFKMYDTTDNTSMTLAVGLLAAQATSPSTSNFTQIGDIISTSARNTWETKTIALSPYTVTDLSSQKRYIAIKSTNTTGNRTAFIDDVEISLIPPCTAPTGVTASNVTGESAVITWDNNDNYPSWRLCYKAATDTDYDTTAVLFDTTYTLTGLTPQTSYNVIVLTDCGDMPSSSVYTFTTDCASLIPSFTESFNTNPFNNCWTMAYGMLSANTVFTSSSPLWSYVSEEGLLRIYINPLTRTDWVISNSISLGFTTDTFQMAFDITLTADQNRTQPHNSLAAQRFAVVVSTDNGATWSNTNAFIWTPGDSQRNYESFGVTPSRVIIPLINPTTNQPYQGNIKIAFYVESDHMATNFMCIDNFTVQPYSTCISPFNLTSVADSLTAFSAAITFTELGQSTDYQYVYDEETNINNPEDGTFITVYNDTIPLTGLNPLTTYKIWVRSICYDGIGGTFYSEWSLPYTFTTTVTCQPPTNTSYSNITTSSVDLSWQPVFNAASYNVIYGVAGFDPATGGTTINNIVDTTFSLTALSEGTRYDIYVQADCSSDTSSMTFVGTITTTCNPIGVPYSENFDSYTGTTYDTPSLVPSCWNAVGSNVPHIVGSGSRGWYPHSNPNALNFSANVSDPDAYAILPAFSTPVENLRISFWYRYEVVMYGKLTIGYITGDQNSTSTYTVLDTLIPTTTLTQYTYNFSTSTNSNLVNATYIVISWKGGGAAAYNASIDDIVIDIPCNPPTGLLSSTTSNSATITWTAGTATSWEVVLQDTVSGTPVSVTSATYTFTGLNASTPYFAYVRTNCGSGNYSSWVLRQFTTDANPVTCAAPTGIASTETQTSAT
ncbi:MAG: fibronectin type III domain-containing protein, partial [Bacteroidales bacterium]|nr:fibronectin type III domain-containing protein [Bacteroidales bacterium]